MSEAKHTALPWYIRHEKLARQIHIETCKYAEDIASISNADEPRDHANAAFIVRATNAHQMLVEALEEVDAWVEKMPEGMRQRVRAALAKATEDHNGA